jgi:hypothetical protein
MEETKGQLGARLKSPKVNQISITQDQTIGVYQ